MLSITMATLCLVLLATLATVALAVAVAVARGALSGVAAEVASSDVIGGMTRDDVSEKRRSWGAHSQVATPLAGNSSSRFPPSHTGDCASHESREDTQRRIDPGTGPPLALSVTHPLHLTHPHARELTSHRPSHTPRTHAHPHRRRRTHRAQGGQGKEREEGGGSTLLQIQPTPHLCTYTTHSYRSTQPTTFVRTSNASVHTQRRQQKLEFWIAETSVVPRHGRMRLEKA